MRPAFMLIPGQPAARLGSWQGTEVPGPLPATARSVGFNFSRLDSPKNENDYYGLRYAEFVMPLVRAVQELNAAKEVLKSTVQELKGQNKKMMERIEKLENK